MSPLPLQRTWRLLASCLLGLALAGCLQTDVTFEVRPDGSGRVIETHRVSENAPWLPTGQGDALWPLTQPKALAERARSMGAGVTAHADPVTRVGGDLIGRVTYEVANFNGLRWRFNSQPGDPSVVYRFELDQRPGQPMALTVVNDPNLVQQLTSRPPAGEPPQPERDPVAQLKAAQGLRLNVQLKVDGTLLKSTGALQDGNETRLLSLDANALMSSAGWEDRLRRLPALAQLGRPCSRAIEPGLHVDCQPRVRIWMR